MRAHRWFLLAGAVASVAYVLVPDGIVRAAVFDGMGLASVVALFVGIERHQPLRLAAWRLVAAGAGLMMAGDLVWDVYELGFHLDPSPSPADVLYLLAYPAMIAGSVLLGRSRRPDVARSATLDGAIAGLGAAILGWHALVVPRLTEVGLTALERIVSSAYPILDLVLIAVVVRMIALLRVRSASSWWLLTGFVSLLVSDLIFAQLQASNAYLSADWLDLGWLASYIALGVAALHPSMKGLGEAAVARSSRLGLGGLLLVAPSLAAGQVVLMLDRLSERDAFDAVVLTAASFVVDALVILRIASAIRGHQRAEAELQDRAVHDPLTGLANRTLARDRFEQAVGRSRRAGGSVALHLVDLDRFKVVVEELGTGAADRLLVDVARRLQGVLRETDTLAKLEADQFLVLSEHPDATEGPRVLADRLLAALAAPFGGDGGELFVRASIGVRTTGGFHPFEVVAGDAEAAMSRAKDRGRNRYEVFDASMRTNGGSKLALETSLRRAIERGELRQVYQPIVDLPTGRVVKLEALVRWEHPERGLLPPSEFVPLAEETGLIVDMDAWGLRQACSQVQVWRDRLGADDGLRVSVNLSAQHLRDADLAVDLRTAFSLSGASPACLTLEITETTLMSDVEASIGSLAGIKALGVEVAVDDFGTGYSSLSYLQRLPVDVLKIDRSFVQGLGEGARDRSIVAATVALAHALDLRVVAEGVETQTQLEVLRELGCDMVQGYLFAKPLPADEALGFVLGRRVAPALVPA
jgi:diguanylate cyclase (GGDEF)-like protein